MANVTLKRWDGTQWVELLPTPRAHTHAASDITSGVFSTARLATGTANSTTFLRGDGQWVTPADNVHDWQWKWKRYATLVTPAGGSAAQWTDYFRTFFYKPTEATMATYPLQAEGYLDTRTQVNAEGGFGGSIYGNMFGDLEQYHAHIYTNIYVEYPFSISISNFNGDDPHAIFIDEVFVHGAVSCCTNTSYSYTFTPGWHRIDLIYAEGGGGDWIRMGWNPKDYTTSIKEMNPHTGFERSVNGTLTVNNNLVWHAGNDGTGSTLDADLLDGQHASYFLDTSGSTQTKSGSLNVSGNVGIGTSSPADVLHIVNNTNNAGIRLERTTETTGNYTFGIKSNGAFEIGETGVSTRLLITKTDGLVGINETSPTAQLQVKSGAVGRVPLIIDTLASQTANLAEFKLNTTTRLVVTKDGKLQAGSGDGEIHVTSQGVRIETLADNNFVPLTVNKDDTNTSARLQQWQFATENVAYVDETGEFYAPAFISISGPNTGLLSLQGSPFISRNINDATATLTVNNANASSTGNLLNLQAAGTNVISFRKDGTLLAPATFTIDPSTHDNIAGKVIILGDLQVDGTTTTINSTTLEIDDKNIELSKGATNKAASDGAGITIDLGTDGTASLLYGSTADAFTFNKGLSVPTITGLSSNASLITRTSTGTNNLLGTFYLEHRTSADMVDGLGSALEFIIKDSANVDNYIGKIGARRNGADNSGRLVFETNNAGTMSEKMTVLSTGNVGIGTINPQSPLHVQATNTGLAALLRLGNLSAANNTTKQSGLILELTDTVGSVKDVSRLIAYPEDVNAIGAGLSFLTRSSDVVAEKMRITGSGNVGIGTTAPITKLQVHGSAWIGNEGSGVAGSQTGALYLGGTLNSNQLWYSASLRVINTDSSPTTWKPRLGFFTQNTSEHLNTNQTERLTILSDSGNVGIGTTTPGHKLTLPHSSNIAWEYGTGDAFEYTTIGKGDGGVPLAFKTTWTGSPTNKIYAFYGLNPSSVETELLTILNGGNVGIGVTNPQQQLDITGNISLGSWTKSGSTYIGLRRNDTGIFGTNGDSGLVIESYNHAAPNNGNFSQRVHLRSHIFDGGSFNALTAYGQNIGIGTDTPLNKLDVRITGADSNDGILISRADTTTTTNEILGGIGFDSTDGNVPSSILEASAYIAAFAAEDHSVGDKGGYLTFGTAPIDQDDDTVSIERMRITSSGAVGIGTTTTPYLLTVNGNVGANGFYASDRITFGDIVGYDTPYIAWNGSSTPYQLRIADPAYEDPIIIDTENVSITANKFIANSNISVGLSLQGMATITTTFTSQSVLASYAVATYATGKFMIQATSGGNRHISELLVTHNGTVSTATEYAILKTAGNLFTVTTDISGGNVRILVTSASATSTVYRTTFTLIGV